MKTLSIEMVKDNGWLLFEAIAGSRAYGLAGKHSDTDFRGVFILPRDILYSLDYTAQVSNQSNDIVFYELGRFIELLLKNNPNTLEMLNLPPECILYRHPVMDGITQEMFLSRLCESSFGNYAFSQIKKANGLEKKILNPVDEERKSVIDFCYIYDGKTSVQVNTFLAMRGWSQTQVGLAQVPHLRNSYNLFVNPNLTYNGIVRSVAAKDVCLSTIPKGEHPLGLLYFNKDGYSVYCKKYKEYWEWVAKRNNERYLNTLTHGKKYDAKNMMHVFRLLHMAKEIAVEKVINVNRNDREFLLNIKQGKYEYEDLIQQATQMKEDLPAHYAASGLPVEPNKEEINKLLIRMRHEYYR